MLVKCNGFIMNHGHEGFGKYLVSKSCELFKKYGVDGLFLDGAIRYEKRRERYCSFVLRIKHHMENSHCGVFVI